MSAFINESWEWLQSGVGVVFGALVTWFATRYSDAIRERRADYDRHAKHKASVDLLLETLNRNLVKLDAIQAQAQKLQVDVSYNRRGVTQIMEMLSYRHMHEVITLMISTGEPHETIAHALDIVQKLEAFDVPLAHVKKWIEEPHPQLKDYAAPFHRFLSMVVCDSQVESDFYKGLQQHKLDLTVIQKESEQALADFFKVQSLSGYVFRKK